VTRSKSETDFDGVIDERVKTQVTEVTLQPDGQISDLNKYFPTRWGPSQIHFRRVGVAAGDPHQIRRREQHRPDHHVSARRCQQAAAMRLKAHRHTFWRHDVFLPRRCRRATQHATAWQAIADSTFADATFDETKIVTDIYTARTARAVQRDWFDGGFEVDIAMATDIITADDFGVVDMILKSLTATAKFAPGNLTQAQVSALLNAQDTGYVFPGQSLSNRTLISSSPAAATTA